MKLRIALLILATAGIGPGRAASQRDASLAHGTVITPLPNPGGGDVRKIALGRALFSDRRLSRTMRVSCASCHDLATNGASANATDPGDSGRRTRFNAPTIFNSAFNFRFGWEANADTLPQFIGHILRDRDLMGGVEPAIRRVEADPDLARRFRLVYGRGADERSIADALGAFVETLVTPEAPFDRWLAGDAGAITPQQVRGYRKFVGLGCASCHQGANVGGNLSQRRGVFVAMKGDGPRYLRVPSLRNVVVTGPYFHDGRTPVLRDAIRQMARSQLNLQVGEQDLSDLVSFLDTLTGSYRGKRLAPPPRTGAR